MASIRLHNITKSYGINEPVLTNITLSIEQGEFLVVVGPSGCGKSTLLRMIAGLEEISSGELFIDEKCVNNVLPKDRDVGMVFQNYALYPHLSVAENIGFPLRLRKMNKVDIEQRVKEVALMLQLENYVHRKPKELSGGQRQRVALGRAIARNPQVFLFDEPLSNLDAQLRSQMRSEILALQRKVGVTGIYVTHDQTEAMTMGDKIAVLHKGKLQQMGTPTEVYNRPHNIFVAQFIGNPIINIIEGIFSEGMFLSESLEIRINMDSIVNPHLVKYAGFRPDGIHIDDSGTYTARVDHCEYIGHETTLYLRVHNEQIRARLSGESIYKQGDIVKFNIRSSEVLFFDTNENSFHF